MNSKSCFIGYIDTLSSTNTPTSAPPAPTLPNIHNVLSWTGYSAASGSCTYAGGVTQVNNKYSMTDTTNPKLFWLVKLCSFHTALSCSHSLNLHVSIKFRVMETWVVLKRIYGELSSGKYENRQSQWSNV